MQARSVSTSFWRDEFVISLPRDERDFFLYLLTSPDISYAGIGLIPEKVMVMDLGFSRDTIQFCKKQLEKSGKIILFDNWVCLPNFWDHNPMLRNGDVLEATGKYLERLPKRVFDFFNTKLKELEAPMSLDGYLEKRRRHRVKKELRKTKKWLTGQALEDEVDRILGISDSGKMDWAAIAPQPPASDHPTPETITREHFEQVAKQFNTRPYILYWHFTRKLLKLDATGRKKHDYLAYLKEIASGIKRELSDDEKINAAMHWAKQIGVTLTRSKAEVMIYKGEL